MMTDDIDEAIDWQGRAVVCDPCAHRALVASGRCRLKHACVHDRYARRIDRFFNWNPSLANGYLEHPHFEVRAIAAKHADIFRLPPLLRDPEETVRWNAARRLPKRMILSLRDDPHREVRIRIANLLDEVELAPMASDPDYYVRLVVARRLPPALLGPLMTDEDAEVRRVVARRIPDEWVVRMMDDKAAPVRVEIAQRAQLALLTRLKADPDWRVRYEVAARIPREDLLSLTEDSDQLVAELARSRLHPVDAQDRRIPLGQQERVRP